MFQMHTCFDLSPNVRIEDFKIALERFSSFMQANGLIIDTGPVMQRCRHPIMDTDEERTHQYFFVMSFTDRSQCDAAVQHIQSADPGSDPVHRAIYEDIIHPIFTCWVDPLQ